MVPAYGTHTGSRLCDAHPVIGRGCDVAWFKVDGKFHSHPKRYKVGLRAMGLWVAAGSWCADQLTDGHIPAAVLPLLGGTRADAKALVDAGLWETRGQDGWAFHDWSDCNRTRPGHATGEPS